MAADQVPGEPSPPASAGLRRRLVDRPLLQHAADVRGKADMLDQVVGQDPLALGQLRQGVALALSGQLDIAHIDRPKCQVGGVEPIEQMR